MTGDTTDYLDRFSGWNTNPELAVFLIENMQPSSLETQLLRIDWRQDDARQVAVEFLGHIGVGTTEAGIPIYEGALFNTHKTSKDKLFFDFEVLYTNTVCALYVQERRVVLPNEGHIAVASFFTASLQTRKSK